MEREIASGWPAFPRELFAAIKETASEGAKLRVVLLDGGVLTAGSVPRDTEAGLLIETDDGTTAAVPWHAVLRIEVQRAGAGKAVGFHRA